MASDKEIGDIEICCYNGVKPPNQILRQVVTVHMNTFTGFFLTFLGKGFLRHLYKGYSMHKDSGLIVAVKSGDVVGFLAYSKELSGLYKYLIRKDLLPFAWYSLIAAIRKPSATVKLIRAFLKPKESKRTEAFIELSSIGVLPQMKNLHIGSRLIDSLKQSSDSDKYSYINLETDASNNDAANNFYIKNGFKLSRTYNTNDGRSMNEYRWCQEK